MLSMPMTVAQPKTLFWEGGYGRVCKSFEITRTDLVVVHLFKVVSNLPKVLIQFRSERAKAKMPSGFDLCDWVLLVEDSSQGGLQASQKPPPS